MFFVEVAKSHALASSNKKQKQQQSMESKIWKFEFSKYPLTKKRKKVVIMVDII